MIKEMSLKGKCVLVTGGATGLGFGIAEQLVDCGAEVILAGRREDVLRSASAKLGNTPFVRLDLADHDNIPALVRSLEERFGPIDALVNNAGIQNNKPALSYENEEFLALFQVNVLGTYVLTREIAKGMAARQAGSIVFITSCAVHMGLTNNLPYTGTKGALSSMCRALASELSPRGIRVNSIAPGWIETDMLRESMSRLPERRARVERRIMLGRLGTPQDIGMAAAFLVSDASAYITGTELRVDGGVSISL